MMLPNAEVGFGPKHQTSPKRELVPMLSEYLRLYPYLIRYREYFEFLECYGGASLAAKPPTSEFMVFLIDGLDNFVEPDSNQLEPDGFHIFMACFGLTRDHRHVEVGFAFSIRMIRMISVSTAISAEMILLRNANTIRF